MQEISILDQIKKLVEIQNIDGKIFSHKKELTEKPAHIAELKAKYEEKKAGLNQLEGNRKELLVDRKTFESELKAKEDQIVQADSQLSQLKTNKEYQAKLTEIEHIKADKSIIEDKILSSFDEVEKIDKLIGEEKKFLEEEEKKYLSEKKEVDDLVVVLKDKVKVLEGQRVQIIPQTDKKTLSMYERILENKEGLAIVPVQGNTCGGCYMNVPAQVINEMKKHEKLVSCEMCARILYLEEEV